MEYAGVASVSVIATVGHRVLPFLPGDLIRIYRAGPRSVANWLIEIKRCWIPK